MKRDPLVKQIYELVQKRPVSWTEIEQRAKAYKARKAERDKAKQPKPKPGS